MTGNAEKVSTEGLGADAQTWRELLPRCIPIMYGMYVRRGFHPALAEELVQQTVFDAVKGRAGFDAARGTPEQWILGIARKNLALELRRRANRPKVDGDISTYLAAIDTAPLPDEVLEREETRQAVRAALAALDEKDRTVVKAKYLEDLPARAIAERMATTEKAVHSLLYRARNALREKLKNIGPPSKEEHPL